MHEAIEKLKLQCEQQPGWATMREHTFRNFVAALEAAVAECEAWRDSHPRMKFIDDTIQMDHIRHQHLIVPALRETDAALARLVEGLK